MIGQALNEGGALDKKSDRRQHEESGRAKETEKSRRAQLEIVYESSSIEEQAVFVRLARQNLLQQGFKLEFLLEPLVRIEVLRLVKEKQEAREPLGAKEMTKGE